MTLFKAYAIPKGTTPADALAAALADYQWRTGQPAPAVHVRPDLAAALGTASVEVIGDDRVPNGLIYVPVGGSATPDMPVKGAQTPQDARNGVQMTLERLADKLAEWQTWWMKQYPAILRERLLRFVDAGHSQAEAARIFGVSPRSITRWRQQAATGDLAPKPRPGRTPRIGPAQVPALEAQVAAAPDATLAEHCAQWTATHGVPVSVATMSRVLAQLGLPLKKSLLRQRAG